MYRKGQYLAVETVLSLGLSVIVATASITLYSGYRSSVVDAIGERDFTAIRSEILTGVHNLQETSSGSYITLNLPQQDQGDYTVSFTDDSLRITVGGETETTELRFNDSVEFSGSVESGDARLTKIQDRVSLRPS
jgi:hypothetical protein